MTEKKIPDNFMVKKPGEAPIPHGYRNKTKMMFFEFRHQNKGAQLPPIFTLKEVDWEYEGTLYKSVYQMYMECNTEYEAAIKILGSWVHWEKLCACSWFHEHLQHWRAEVKTREEAIAKDALVNKAQAGDVSASRAILTKPAAKRGAPKRGGSGVKGSRPDIPEDIDDILSGVNLPDEE